MDPDEVHEHWSVLDWAAGYGPGEGPMPIFKYVVYVEAETQEQATEVMEERINNDEDYGFRYRIEFKAE